MSQDSHSTAMTTRVAIVTGANSGIFEACTIGATMRRRWRQRSPSLMNSPSPSRGDSAWRICGVLRWKLSCRPIKACDTVSGLLQTNTRRVRSLVEKNWYSKHLSSNIARKLRRAAAIVASGGSAFFGRSG